MVADGDGEFTRAMGMAADLRYLGLNLRSRRYAMIVNDGVIKHLNVEAGHQVHTSGADAMLKLL
jgi:peroxiredoxin